MITRDDLNRFLGAIITTLEAAGEAPESALFLGIGKNEELWQAVKEVLMMGDLATFSEDHMVRLTSKGREMAAEINAWNAEHGYFYPKNENELWLALILTLNEVDCAPESAISDLAGADPEDWRIARRIMIDDGVITIDKNNMVRLTPKGRAEAKEVIASMGAIRHTSSKVL